MAFFLQRGMSAHSLMRRNVRSWRKETRVIARGRATHGAGVAPFSERASSRITPP